MVKLTVYIHTIKLGTVSFVDKEGAMHACAQAQSTAFKELTRLSGLFGNRYLCDDDRNTLLKVESFCRNKGLEYDIVDLGTMNFLTRLRLRIAGIRTSTICCGKERFFGILSEEDLQKLVSAQ
jgi:hypothetical protein